MPPQKDGCAPGASRNRTILSFTVDSSWWIRWRSADKLDTLVAEIEVVGFQKGSRFEVENHGGGAFVGHFLLNFEHWMQIIFGT
jgi:hypothetical protein